MSFSLGIKVDHPAFVFLQYGIILRPQECSRGVTTLLDLLPVGTPAKSLLAFVQRRGRADNVGGSESGTEANSSMPPNLSGLGIGIHPPPPGAVDNSSSVRPGYTMQGG